ncbi:MAG: hypothetical protein Q7K98_06810 [Candidatus Omnitrophota bacterium]|nr:hypothetical protein [Candidatus Omnitrophota bacterium]
MNKKFQKLLKRIKQQPIDPLWLRSRQLHDIKAIYEGNPNLPPNVRMANAQLVQNDIIALHKKLKKRKRLTLLKVSKI